MAAKKKKKARRAKDTAPKVPIKSLKPYFRNPRTHTKEQVETIAASIERFGFINPILVDETNLILAGHGRLAAAKMLGLKEVPVRVVYGLTEAKKRAYCIADNRIAELVGWDEKLLGHELLDLKGHDFDLAGLGFDDDELTRLLAVGEETRGETDEDEVPEVEKEVKTKEGDIWLLDNHRLLCGDGTDKKQVARLMNGSKATMTFTDPPYNVDYGSSKETRHKIRKIENDDMKLVDWKTFSLTMAAVIRENCKGDVYCWVSSGPPGMRFSLWMIEEGLHWSATIVWKKQQLILTPAKYQRIYEACLYGWFGKSSFTADRKQVEVWEVDRPYDSKLHPTMKPVELVRRAVGNSTKKGNIVFDPFMGSGSTLIGCEETGRVCYGVEIDPAYCDVTVRRWQEFTGKKAKLEGTGKLFDKTEAVDVSPAEMRKSVLPPQIQRTWPVKDKEKR